MVAQGGGIIVHIVEDVGTEMPVGHVHHVVIVGRRLSLEDVAIVEEQHGRVALSLPKAADIRGHPGQTAASRHTAIEEIVGEEVAVYVGSLQ